MPGKFCFARSDRTWPGWPLRVPASSNRSIGRATRFSDSPASCHIRARSGGTRAARSASNAASSPQSSRGPALTLTRLLGAEQDTNHDGPLRRAVLPVVRDAGLLNDGVSRAEGHLGAAHDERHLAAQDGDVVERVRGVGTLEFRMVVGAGAAG